MGKFLDDRRGGDHVRDGTGKNRRPPFEVELIRTGENWRTLGLLVSPDDDPRYLIVDDIWSPSLVSEWNSEHPEALIEPGDIITAVDGVACGGDDMLQKIQATRDQKGCSLK